jgi:sensor domain CHASE-containing protein
MNQTPLEAVGTFALFAAFIAAIWGAVVFRVTWVRLLSDNERLLERVASLSGRVFDLEALANRAKTPYAPTETPSRAPGAE